MHASFVNQTTDDRNCHSKNEMNSVYIKSTKYCNLKLRKESKGPSFISGQILQNCNFLSCCCWESTHVLIDNCIFGNWCRYPDILFMIFKVHKNWNIVSILLLFFSCQLQLICFREAFVKKKNCEKCHKGSDPPSHLMWQKTIAHRSPRSQNVFVCVCPS